MDRKKLYDVGGISALAFSLLGTASVLIWHSRLILFIFLGLAIVGFLIAITSVLLELDWHKVHRTHQPQTQNIPPYKQEPKSETRFIPPPEPEVIKIPLQIEPKKKGPLDDEGIRSRLIGQRNMATAESAIKGEKHNARILYNRGLRKYHLTDADVAEYIEKEKGI
jgi:hypothetical protein